MKRQFFIVVIMLLVIWAVFIVRLSAPWYGTQEAFRVWIQASVENYDRYAYDDIGLMVVRNVTPVEDLNDLYFYSHHPPLLVWIPAITTRFTGMSELSMRYVFVAAMMLASSAFYVFVRRLYDEKVALTALFFFVITPLIGYFQRVPGHDPLGFMAIMLFATVLVNWFRTPTRPRLLLLLGLAWLAVWTAWPAVIFVGVLGITVMILGKRQHRIGVVLMGVVSVAAFVVMMLMYESMWSQSLESLLEAYVWRASMEGYAPGTNDVSILKWVIKNTTDVLIFSAPTFVFLSFLGIRPITKQGDRISKGLWLGMLLAGGLYLLIFRNAALMHNFYKAFLVPAMAIAAAAAWQYRRQFRSRWMKPLIEILAVGAVVWSVGLIAMLHSTGNQPIIDALITYINEETPPDEYINVSSLQYGHIGGYWNATMFYTQRDVGWQPNFDRALDAAAEKQLPLRYIYCPYGESQLPEALQDVTGTSFGDGACTAYVIE